MKLSRSTGIYIGLVIVYAALSAVSIFLPSFQGMVPTQELPASKPVLAVANAGIVLLVYGLLGFLGLKLSRKIGFADIWEASVSNRQRFLVPAIVGIVIGVVFIVGDTIFSRFSTIGPYPILNSRLLWLPR